MTDRLQEGQEYSVRVFVNAGLSRNSSSAVETFSELFHFVTVLSLMHSCCTACFVTGFLYYNNLVNISLTHIIIYMLYLPCRG